MSEELILALEYLEQEKGIDKEKLIQAVEAALLSAARRVLGAKKEDLDVKFDPTSGDIKVFLNGEEVSSHELGRIAAQTAKQVIMQKLKEAEKETVYEEYKDRVGDVLLATVHRKERGDVIMELEKAEALLPRSEQPRGEVYRQGQKMKVLVIDVRKTGRPPQIVVSRKSPQLVRKLFEIEVPEIQEGLVEIVAIAREAGERTKIAVHSRQENVDPVGSCVGMKGTRVKNIVEELGGEKIDIIRYSEDPKEFIKSALYLVSDYLCSFSIQHAHMGFNIEIEILKVFDQFFAIQTQFLCQFIHPDVIAHFLPAVFLSYILEQNRSPCELFCLRSLLFSSNPQPRHSLSSPRYHILLCLKSQPI